MVRSRFTKIIVAAVVMLLPTSVSLAAETTTIFKVTGMYCDACQTKIQQALKKTDGVKSATVSLDKGMATVIYDNAKVKPDQIVQVIEKEGYKAEPQSKSKY